MRTVLIRLVHLLGVLTIFAFVILPALPNELGGELKTGLVRAAKFVSVKQYWAMYAPNPQRSQTYMELTAVHDDHTERPLEETVEAERGWGTTWAWNKTRVDIWRHYANFHPDKRNNNRTWYLRGVCVREARRGPIPNRIVMHQVRRRFAPPAAVLQGRDGLGKPTRKLITVQYCKTKPVLEMIERDRARQVGDD